MICRENELGWRLHKGWFGFAIKHAHPPLRSRIRQLGPVFLNLLLVLAVWLSGGGTERVRVVLYASPFSLLLGLWCFRPGVLYVSVRRRILGDATGGMPFSWLRTELSQDQESGLYRVYLRGDEPSEATTQVTVWKRLVWESPTEAEASAVAEECQTWGIGVPDPIILAVRGDKRLRLLAYGGHLLSVAALVAFVAWMGHRSAKGLVEARPMALLRAVQIIIAFLFLSVLPFATYLWRLGRGAVRQGQMPPPGMMILSDMKLLVGDKAVMRGRILASIGVVLIIVGLVGGLYVPYKLQSLYGAQLRPATPIVSHHKQLPLEK